MKGWLIMAQVVREDFAALKYWLGLSTLLTAADDDKIVASANMKNGAYTIAAQPSAPSLIGIKATAVDTADTMGIVTMVAVDVWGQTFTEVITPVAGSTVYSTRYAKSITSLTGSGWAIDAVDGSNDTLIIGVLASAGIECRGANMTIIVATGNVWINPRTTAVADVTSIKLTAGQSLDLVVNDVLSLISDASGATFQVLFWE